MDHAPGLADAMRARTATLHRQAEESGVVHAILTGRVTQSDYALFLRNLLPVYVELEQGLEACRGRRGLDALCRRELFRRRAIESDLVGLSGRDWQEVLPLLPSGRLYAGRVAAAAEGDGSL